MSHDHGRYQSNCQRDLPRSNGHSQDPFTRRTVYHWYQRLSCYVLCLIWSTRWYRCGFIMTVTGSHVDQKWRRGRFVKVNVRQWMKQPPDSFKCPLPSQHMASDIQHFFHTRIPDSVWTLQNVRIIKLMAINEGGGGWQGYKPPTSLVISSPDAWSCSAAQWSHHQDNVLSPFIPRAEITSHLSLSSFCSCPQVTLTSR